jgi:hypothetical protein
VHLFGPGRKFPRAKKNKVNKFPFVSFSAYFQIPFERFESLIIGILAALPLNLCDVAASARANTGEASIREEVHLYPKLLIVHRKVKFSRVSEHLGCRFVQVPIFFFSVEVD